MLVVDGVLINNYMIIEKEYYRRNKHGEITNHQKVLVKCDNCGFEWESLYSDRKKKKNKLDLCFGCRNTREFKPRKNTCKKSESSENIKCDYCGKIFKKYKNLLGKVNYCCAMCRDNATLDKYDHLYAKFEQNLDEVAYLCGLMLGDGNLNGIQKRATKINIAFDARKENLIEFAKSILSKLGITFSMEPAIQQNCQKINLSLPNNLLQKYGMLWSGNKYDAQPYPSDDIIHNKKFIGGLINSDGHAVHTGKHEAIRFTNTCESIIRALEESLIHNKIEFNKYSYEPTIHKKTGNYQKRSYILYIGNKKNMNLLHDGCMILKIGRKIK